MQSAGLQCIKEVAKPHVGASMYRDSQKEPRLGFRQIVATRFYHSLAISVIGCLKGLTTAKFGGWKD